jgi:UDP-N-acetylglucosamine 2-epimerase (non-hydrolysing)
MVQGDTASAYAAALAANQLRINLAHVEAGIRTGDVDDPWPEEIFRTHIDAVARWKYCATNANYFNTAPDTPPDPGEACGCDHSRVTGNPGIDALYAHTQPTRTVEDCVLITLHRRESFGKPLRQLITGLLKSAERHAALTFAWPLHPNPRVLEAINADVADHYLPPPNLEVMDPLPMVDFAGWLSTSRCVITDSGGVQEEAAALGIPCCVAREKTDRPESVDVGLAKVIGRTAPGVLDGLDWALGFSTRPDPSPCFGDGHAAPRIVDHLLSVSG